MKKIYSILYFILLTLFLSSILPESTNGVAYADNITSSVFRNAIGLKINSPYAYIYDSQNNMDWILFLDKDNINIIPFINNNRTMVPLRFISEHMNAKVDWNSESRSVTITSGSTVISLTINMQEMDVNGQPIYLDSAPVIRNNRTYLPLRAIAEALDKSIYYENGIILLKDGDIDDLWKNSAAYMAKQNLSIIYDNLGTNIGEKEFKSRCMPILFLNSQKFNGKYVAYDGNISNLQKQNNKISFTIENKTSQWKNNIDYQYMEETTYRVYVTYTGSFNAQITNGSKITVYGKLNGSTIKADYID